MATRTLYELAGLGEIRFSPYCWRTIFALKHKGLEFDRVAMKFTDRACIAASGQDRVPVLDDDGHVVSDSWAIVCYLEDRYPDVPSLFGGAIGQGTALVFNKWVDMTVHAELRPLAVPGAFKHVDPDDREWFRASREAMFGMTIEALSGSRPEALERFRAVLEPVRAALASQAFLCGEQPAYADYILFGTFMWPACVSEVSLFDKADPIDAWRTRMLGLFDGFAAAAPTYTTTDTNLHK